KTIVQHFISADGLADNSCGRMFLDSNKLFLSTGNGVSILQKENDKWKIYKTLTMQDGLLSNNINDVTADKLNIYLATVKGLSVISRSAVSSHVYYSKVNITEIISDASQVINKENYS